MWVKGCVICVLIYVSPVFASNNVVLQNYIDKAAELKLYSHPVWYKLLSYGKASISSKKVRSSVHQEEFFLSKSGKVSPKGELNSTLRAFYLPIEKNVNTHAICRFPARYIWLQKKLKLVGLPSPEQVCSDFNEWTHGNTVQSISIVFASGYMGNPGSYYGHILLKLNSGAFESKSSLLDQTVNYGVIATNNDDPVTYMVKGVLGGYEGGFSEIQYDFHAKNYGELELRDIWEYELLLSEDEVNFIVAHAWEVLGKTHTYFFFKENCVTRLAELLEVVEGVSVVPKNPIFILPQAFLKELANTRRNGESLVRALRFHPSRQSRLYNKYSDLTSQQRNFVHDAVADEGELDSTFFKQLSVESRKKILATLLDYLEFSKASKALPEEFIKSFNQKVLLKRLELSVGDNLPQYKSLYTPHEDREPSYLKIGIGRNKELGEFFQFDIRPTYYDALDGGSGFPDHSALSMGELKLIGVNGSLKIREFNFVKIESINGAVTRLPGDNGSAWKFGLGVKQQNLSCFDCLLLRLGGDYGLTLNPTPDFMIGGYVGGGLQNKRNGLGNIFFNATTFSNVEISKKLNFKISYIHPIKVDGAKKEDSSSLLEARYRLGLNNDVRFLYQKKRHSEFGFSLGFYF